MQPLVELLSLHSRQSDNLCMGVLQCFHKSIRALITLPDERVNSVKSVITYVGNDNVYVVDGL